MRLLTQCGDDVLAAQLQEALEAAGIEVQVLTEATNSFLGKMEYAIWVDEKSDEDVVNEVCALLMKSRENSSQLGPETRVSPAFGKLKCRSCGYDLRGQVGNGKCPECGHPYRVLVQKRCAACNSDVPGNFEVCWNCGGDVDPVSTP